MYSKIYRLIPIVSDEELYQVSTKSLAKLDFHFSDSFRTDWKPVSLVMDNPYVVACILHPAAATGGPWCSSCLC